ncbi:hypothetical protein A8V01_12025 [Novosphingobium guangzhouense]|uniref:Uncharacterized protein n=2 Tax=Novosphingobium guangzhouense TaxID=1850347 RepID=A0A2K2FSU9_9SPHN|nr:hypothetical protein A8V01_12025 [Novosphingobium guangzhouense]
MHPVRQPSRWKRNLILLTLLGLVLWLGWTWRGLREEALVGAAYGARVGCVCRYVSQRPMDTCEGDLKVVNLKGAGRWVSLSEDAQTRTVKASVPLLAKQSADFDPARGCRLEPWQD